MRVNYRIALAPVNNFLLLIDTSAIKRKQVTTKMKGNIIMTTITTKQRRNYKQLISMALAGVNMRPHSFAGRGLDFKTVYIVDIDNPQTCIKTIGGADYRQVFKRVHEYCDYLEHINYKGCANTY